MSTDTEHLHRESVIKGSLPVNIGVLLLGIAGVVTAYITNELTVPLAVTSVVFASGTIAAIGVRFEDTSSINPVNIGVLSLGVGGIGYVAAFAVGFTMNAYSEMPMYIAPVILSCVFLIPVGIISNTLQSFGYGQGKEIVMKYTISVVLIGVLTMIAGIVNVAGLIPVQSVTSASAPGAIQGSNTPTIVLRVFGVIMLSAGALYLFKALINRFPLSVFFPITGIDTVTTIREKTSSIVDIGLRVIGIYVLLCLAWGGTFIVQQQFQPVFRSVIQATSTVEVLYVLGVCNAMLLALLVLKRLVVYLSQVTQQDLLGIGVFPIISLLGVLIATQFYQAEIITQAETIPIVSPLVVTAVERYPVMVLLGAVTVVAVIPVGLYTTPTTVARIRTGHKSLTGVIVTIVGLTGLGLISVLSWQTATPILLAVIGSLVIWGVSEYTITAIGELQQPATSTVPEDTYKTIGVQSTGIILTGIIAVGVTIAAVTLLNEVNISRTAGEIILLVAIAALLPLTYIMSG